MRAFVFPLSRVIGLCWDVWEALFGGGVSAGTETQAKRVAAGEFSRDGGRESPSAAWRGAEGAWLWQRCLSWC